MTILHGVLWHGIQNHSLVKKISHYPNRMVLQVLYLDLIGYHHLAKGYGQPIAFGVLDRVHRFLKDKADATPYAMIEPLWDDAFILVAPAEIDLMAWLYEFEQTPITLDNGVRYSPSFHAGISFIEMTTTDTFDLAFAIYRALMHAAFVGKSSQGLIDGKMAREFDRIVGEQLITSYYQPIFALDDGVVLGYEALSRGPEDSSLHMPDAIFEVGGRLGRLFELEQLCRKTAIANAPIHSHERLFLNINPQTLNDPIFVKGRTKEWARTKGLTTTQIVFEITEHEAIADYGTFRKTVDHYREQGFLVAIDDTGSGYSGLLTLVELTPDFIKLDRGLISQIEKSPSKQAMVEAMVMVARKIGAKTIAEGIETIQELEIVKALGADYGQGFLLGRPSPVVSFQSAV